MAEQTSEMMENWCTDINAIADELENAWSDPLGVQSAEYLRQEVQSINGMVQGAQDLENVLMNCSLYCEEILSGNDDESDAEQHKYLSKRL